MPDANIPEEDDADVIWQPTDEESTSAKDSLVELLEHLRAEENNGTCNVILYSKRGRDLEDRYRRLNMTQELADEFQEEYKARACNVISSIEDGDEVLRPYAFGENVEDTILFLPLNAFGPVLEQLNDIPNDTWEAHFDPQQDIEFLKKLKSVFVSMKFDRATDRLILAQVRSPTKLVKRGISALFNRNQFEAVETSNVLTFEPAVDFLIWQDFVFLVRLDKFETLLGFREHTLKIARTVFEGIVGHLPIHNHEAVSSFFASRVRHTKKLAKLAYAKYLPNLDMNAIQAQIDLHSLPMSIQEIDGENRIVLNDPSDPNVVMDLLRLFDDDFYHSDLTDRFYAARAKDWRG